MLAIIIVNYKNEEQTLLFINNELSKTILPNIIVVVNNEATYESNNVLVKGLKAELITDISEIRTSKRIFVVSHSENLGYARGNNLGVEFAIKHFNIDNLLFTNNDIRLIENETIERLSEKLNGLPTSIAAIGPAVIGLSGENQNPHIYVSLFKKWVLGLWYVPLLNKTQRIRFFNFDHENPNEGLCYTVMGSFFLVRKSDFLKCNMFDENTFLYSEEAIFAERLLTIGKSIFFYPKITVLHEHNLTIGKHYNANGIANLMFMSDEYFYSTYMNTSRLTIFFCKISMKLHFGIKRIMSKIN
jgi:GT2 family glycosyltransferase